MISVFGSPIQAGAEDDALILWGARYKKAFFDLRFGSIYEKINAAQLMGAHRKSKFIRPLGAELLHHLENQKFLSMPTNDPYIKAQIAWALGEIGHPMAVPSLIKALDISLQLAKKENEEIKKRQVTLQKVEDRLRKEELEIVAKNRQKLGSTDTDASDQQYKIKIVALGYERPGPFLADGYSFPNSADMNWSIADEFRGAVYDYKYEALRVRMKEGANWLNLSRAIFSALGKIGDRSAIDTVKKYMASDFPIVRGYAAQSLGEIAKNAEDDSALLVVKEKYTSEKDERVQTYMAYAVLSNDKTNYAYYLDLLSFLKSDEIRKRYDAIRVLDQLALGESEYELREALKIESNEMLQGMLQKAIYKAKMDNALPVNY